MPLTSGLAAPPPRRLAGMVARGLLLALWTMGELWSVPLVVLAVGVLSTFGVLGLLWLLVMLLLLLPGVLGPLRLGGVWVVPLVMPLVTAPVAARMGLLSAPALPLVLPGLFPVLTLPLPLLAWLWRRRIKPPLRRFRRRTPLRRLLVPRAWWTRHGRETRTRSRRWRIWHWGMPRYWQGRSRMVPRGQPQPQMIRL